MPLGIGCRPRHLGLVLRHAAISVGCILMPLLILIWTLSFIYAVGCLLHVSLSAKTILFSLLFVFIEFVPETT